MHKFYFLCMHALSGQCSVWSQREGGCDSKLVETRQRREFFKSDNTDGDNGKSRVLSEGAASRAFERTVGGQGRGDRL